LGYKLKNEQCSSGTLCALHGVTVRHMLNFSNYMLIWYQKEKAHLLQF